MVHRITVYCQCAGNVSGTMSILIQFSNVSKEKLALLEKPKDFLEKSCHEVREIMSGEIGELLPESYRFMIWGNPMSKMQEFTSEFRKCAVLAESSNEYPKDVNVYVVKIQEVDIPKGVQQPCLNVDECSEQRREHSSAKPSESAAVGDHKGIEILLKNLEAEKTALTYRYQVAEATLSSLREKPRNRITIGGNVAFTCSKCYYKGHRVTGCRQAPCQGFFECGIASLHKDQRDNLKKAELEVRTVKKMLNDKTEEIKNTTFMKQRTKTNFFSVMRRRLQEVNPIKYSKRVELDNDLRVLAAACSHKPPGEDEDLEAIIANYRNRANSVQSLSMHHGKEQRAMDPHTNTFHQLCTTKTIVRSPTINYAQTSTSTSHYQFATSDVHSSPNLPLSQKRKKLTYESSGGVQLSSGAKWRKRTNEQYNVEYDDDETQDIPSDNDETSPKAKRSEVEPLSDLQDIDSFPDDSESQQFSYGSWVAKQQCISRSIANDN